MYIHSKKQITNQGGAVLLVCLFLSCLACDVMAAWGGGESDSSAYMKGVGMLVGNFELNP